MLIDQRKFAPLKQKAMFTLRTPQFPVEVVQSPPLSKPDDFVKSHVTVQRCFVCYHCKEEKSQKALYLLQKSGLVKVGPYCSDCLKICNDCFQQNLKDETSEECPNCGNPMRLKKLKREEWEKLGPVLQLQIKKPKRRHAKKKGGSRFVKTNEK